MAHAHDTHTHTHAHTHTHKLYRPIQTDVTLLGVLVQNFYCLI